MRAGDEHTEGLGASLEGATEPRPTVVIDPEARSVTGVLSNGPTVVKLGLRDFRALEAIQRIGEPTLVVDAKDKDLLTAYVLLCRGTGRPVVAGARYPKRRLVHVVVDLSHVNLRFTDAEQAELAGALDGYALDGWRVADDGLHAWALDEAADVVVEIVRTIITENGYVGPYETA